jgi:hypothetical protein
MKSIFPEEMKSDQELMRLIFQMELTNVQAQTKSVQVQMKKVHVKKKVFQLQRKKILSRKRTAFYGSSHASSGSQPHSSHLKNRTSRIENNKDQPRISGSRLEDHIGHRSRRLHIVSLQRMYRIQTGNLSSNMGQRSHTSRTVSSMIRIWSPRRCIHSVLRRWHLD